MTTAQRSSAAVLPALNSTEAVAFYSDSLVVFYLWFLSLPSVLPEPAKTQVF